MTRVILVRHCEAFGNTQGLFQGHTDCDISGNGETQLALLGLRCRNMQIDALYTSPLIRARKTAEAINAYHHLELQIEPRLIEINGGDFEGVPFDELPQRFPQQMKIWTETPGFFSAPNGETMRQVYERGWSALQDLVGKNMGKTIAATSHGCTIRNILCHALQKPLEKLGEVDWCDNTAISILEFDDAMQVNVVSMNDASHIPQEHSIYAKQSWWKRPQTEEHA